MVTNKLPVVSNSVLDFESPDTGLAYQGLLYELQVNDGSGNAADVIPNWFGVAIPSPESFDLSSDVYVIIYFHETANQFKNFTPDARTGNLVQIYAYADRLAGQMAAAIQAKAPNNRLVIFPFFKGLGSGYTLPISEWFNVIHDILKDINTNLVDGICTRPKKIIVASFSNGPFYLNKFLNEAKGNPNYDSIVEVWDFDSDIADEFINPQGKPLRAYWQAVPDHVDALGQKAPAPNELILLPSPSWKNFPDPPPAETPPLKPEVHHQLRDTMLLDATWNIENDNP